MQPATLVFSRLIEAIDNIVGRSLATDEIDNDPLAGPGIVDRAVKTVVGEPTTQEALVIMASIDNIDDYHVDTQRMDEDYEMSFVIGKCLECVINQRLTDLKNSVAVLSFAAGFPAAAEKIVSLAEEAIERAPNSKRVSAEMVAETRAALERILDREGSAGDLKFVLQSRDLLGGLLATPNDHVAWSRHGLEPAEAESAARELKAYEKLLGHGQRLGGDALVALSNRADSQLRANAHTGKVAPPSP